MLFQKSLKTKLITQGIYWSSVKSVLVLTRASQLLCRLLIYIARHEFPLPHLAFDVGITEEDDASRPGSALAVTVVITASGIGELDPDAIRTCSREANEKIPNCLSGKLPCRHIGCMSTSASIL